MLIMEGQVYRVAEGPNTLLGMANMVLDSEGAKEAFAFSVVIDGGLQRTMFTPEGDLIETKEAVLVRGHEFGTGLTGKMLIFKDARLSAEVGPLLIT